VVRLKVYVRVMSLVMFLNVALVDKKLVALVTFEKVVFLL
jgi:hypothetical protein